MPRPARPWFRFYTEALHDPKLRRMPATHRWVWVAVLGAARQSCVPGVLLVSETQPMDEHDLADLSAVPVREIRKALDAMKAAGMVSRNEDEAWFVTKWNERQFETDNTTERTRKHRSKERGWNVPTAFPGTPPDTETETDTPTSSDNSHSGGDPPDDDDGSKPSRDPMLETVLAVLAMRDLNARVTAKGNVGDTVSWTNAVIDRRRATDGKRIAALIEQHPELDPDSVADLVAPPVLVNGHRDPKATAYDGQQRAQLATAERHLRVISGDACQACNDTGWTLDEDGNAAQCKHP